jgi:hypothetical protein
MFLTVMFLINADHCFSFQNHPAVFHPSCSSDFVDSVLSIVSLQAIDFANSYVGAFSFNTRATKNQATFFQGSSAISYRPVAFRPRLPTGLAFLYLHKLYDKQKLNVKTSLKIV